MIQKVEDAYSGRFAGEATLFQAPGRINLLGEHIDYNQGFVLPAAINQYITMAVGLRNDERIQLYSLDYQAEFSCPLSSLTADGPMWTRYILGVVDQFQKRARTLSGFNLVFSGNIAQGAGLSSSAALECATAVALQQLHGWTDSRVQLARLAQAAENHFVGVNCGIMDQFASMLGKQGCFMQLDCQSLDYSYLPFTASDYSFVLFDSRVEHSLAASAYNQRREQCEEGLRIIQQSQPEIDSFRALTPKLLERYEETMDPVIYKRCRYVVEEIQRTGRAAEALRSSNFRLLGELMYATHQGLSQQYQVSCPELDFLVNFSRERPAVLGARMMGGGFGGCSLNLIKTSRLEEETSRIKQAYYDRFKQELPSYPIELVGGARRIYAEQTNQD